MNETERANFCEPFFGAHSCIACNVPPPTPPHLIAHTQSYLSGIVSRSLPTSFRPPSHMLPTSFVRDSPCHGVKPEYRTGFRRLPSTSAPLTQLTQTAEDPYVDDRGVTTEEDEALKRGSKMRRGSYSDQSSGRCNGTGGYRYKRPESPSESLMGS